MDSCADRLDVVAPVGREDQRAAVAQRGDPRGAWSRWEREAAASEVNTWLGQHDVDGHQAAGVVVPGLDAASGAVLVQLDRPEVEFPAGAAPQQAPVRRGLRPEDGASQLPVELGEPVAEEATSVQVRRAPRVGLYRGDAL